MLLDGILCLTAGGALHGEPAHELIERTGPALLMACPRSLRLEARMGQGDLGAGIDAFQVNLDARELSALVRLAAGGPLPAHDQAFGLDDFEILSGALMLAAVDHAEAHPKSASDVYFRLGKEHRAGVRPPPLRYAIRRGQRFENDRWPRADPAHQGNGGHRRIFLTSASLLSAYAARRSRLFDQKRS